MKAKAHYIPELPEYGSTECFTLIKNITLTDQNTLKDIFDCDFVNNKSLVVFIYSKTGTAHTYFLHGHETEDTFFNLLSFNQGSTLKLIFPHTDFLFYVDKPLCKRLNHLKLTQDYFNKYQNCFSLTKLNGQKSKTQHSPLYVNPNNLPSLRKLILYFLHKNLAHTVIINYKIAFQSFLLHESFIDNLELPISIKKELVFLHRSCPNRIRNSGYIYHSSISENRFYLREKSPLSELIDFQPNKQSLDHLGNSLFPLSFDHKAFFTYRDFQTIRKILISQNKNLFPSIGPVYSDLCTKLMNESIGEITRIECPHLIDSPPHNLF